MLILTPQNMKELRGCLQALALPGAVRIQFPSGGWWNFPDEPDDEKRAARPKRIESNMRGFGNLFGAVKGLDRLNPKRTFTAREIVPEVPEGCDAIPDFDEWQAGWPLTMADGTRTAFNYNDGSLRQRKLYEKLRPHAIHPRMPS